MGTFRHTFGSWEKKLGGDFLEHVVQVQSHTPEFTFLEFCSTVVWCKLFWMYSLANFGQVFSLWTEQKASKATSSSSVLMVRLSNSSKTHDTVSWWKKSCTSWYVVYPMIGSLSHYLQGFIHPRWLAGCLPSTVSSPRFTSNFNWDLKNILHQLFMLKLQIAVLSSTWNDSSPYQCMVETCWKQILYATESKHLPKRALL